MKILVKGNNWLGDVVMSLPAIAALRQMFGDSHVTVLTRSSVADVYALVECVDEVISYRRSMQAMREVIGCSFDLAIVFPRSFSSALMAFTSGAKRRVGYASDLRSSMLTDAVEDREEMLGAHRVHYYYRLLEVFGKPPVPKFPEMKISGDAIRKFGLEANQPLVTICPGATYGVAKRWLPERFAELIKALALRFQAKIVLAGSDAEHDIANKILKQVGSDKAASLVGKTNISELCALFRASRLVVSNDTGTAHLADAVGTPVVTIFGSTDPLRTAPFNSRGRVIYKKVECSPCFKRICPYGHYNCMMEISVREVYDLAAKILGE